MSPSGSPAEKLLSKTSAQSRTPETSEPIRRQFGVPHEPRLQCARIVAGVRQCIATCVPQHMRMDREWHLRPFTQAGNQCMKALRRQAVTINLTAGTIAGFADCPVEIETADALVVTFSCSYDTEISVMYLVGGIDRVTGDAEATSVVWRKETANLVSETIYELKCRLAQRTF